MYGTFLGMSLIFTAMTVSKGTPPPTPASLSCLSCLPSIVGGTPVFLPSLCPQPPP